MIKTQHADPAGSLTGTFAAGDRDAFDELAEEFTARCRRGEAPSISEYEARYPAHAARIRALLPTVAMMEQLKRDSRPAEANPPSPLPPEQLGEFRLVREIGRGAMGVVYAAVQESLGRTVALKVIHQVQLDVKRRQRFEREARAIARLHHTNIVPIYGVGEHEGLPYYAMQYIQGVGLDQLLAAWRNEGPTRSAERWRLVASVGVQAAKALRYAHEQGVLHRDIKPANLMLDAYQTVWVTDFGLAKLAGHEDLTATGDVVGTLRYLAPEVLQGQCDGRSDVYSLGLTLYELVTLSAPFGDLSQSELLRRVSEGDLAHPRRLAPGIPRDLETIVLKATAREPRHRYATAGALAGDLARFLEDRPIHARRTMLIERAWRWARRKPGTAVLGASAAGALLLAGVVGWAGYMSTTNALEQESRRRGAAEIATRRAEANVALSLKVFEKLFESLAGDDDLLPPPLGRTGGPRPDRAARRSPPGEAVASLADHAGWGEPPNAAGSVPARQRRRPPGAPPRKPAASRENVAFLESVLEFYDEFARTNATNLKLQGEAAWAYRKVGAIYDRLGRGQEAEKAYTRAIAMFEGLIARFPDAPEYRGKLVKTADMADPWSTEPAALGRLEQRLERAQQLIDELVAEVPDDVDYAMLRAHVWAKHGVVLQRLKRLDEAEACYRRAIALDGQLIERVPEFDRPRLARATTRETLALLRLDRNQNGEARALLEAALEELKVLASWSHTPPPLAGRLDSLAAAFDRIGDPDRAAQASQLAAEASARRPPMPPGPPPRSLRSAGSRY